MNSNYLFPGNDLEGDARESEKLQIVERMPQPRRLEMPVMSDGELYLRIGVPDGLQVNSDQPTTLVISIPRTQGFQSSSGSIRK